MAPASALRQPSACNAEQDPELKRVPDTRF